MLRRSVKSNERFHADVKSENNVTEWRVENRYATFHTLTHTDVLVYQQRQNHLNLVKLEDTGVHLG